MRSKEAIERIVQHGNFVLANVYKRPNYQFNYRYLIGKDSYSNIYEIQIDVENKSDGSRIILFSQRGSVSKIESQVYGKQSEYRRKSDDLVLLSIGIQGLLPVYDQTIIRHRQAPDHYQWKSYAAERLETTEEMSKNNREAEASVVEYLKERDHVTNKF